MIPWPWLESPSIHRSVRRCKLVQATQKVRPTPQLLIRWRHNLYLTAQVYFCMTLQSAPHFDWTGVTWSILTACRVKLGHGFLTTWSILNLSSWELGSIMWVAQWWVNAVRFPHPRWPLATLRASRVVTVLCGNCIRKKCVFGEVFIFVTRVRTNAWQQMTCDLWDSYLKESLKLDIGARNKKRPIDDLTALCVPAAKTSI